MTWMNRYDVDEALDHYAHRRPDAVNYGKAAYILAALVAWVDGNSDGWGYWPKPTRAAARLTDRLDGFRRRWIDDDTSDLTDEELRAAVRPVLSFLTRQVNSDPNGYRAAELIESAEQLRAHIDEVTS
jgi:hypothetical protein